MTISDEPSLTQLVVLALVARCGPLTSYDLKVQAARTTGIVWPIPHAQLYRDPQRLAELGLLEERQETHGRRRRVFHLTEAGRRAVHDWLTADRTPEPVTRDPALLKLAFIDLEPPEALESLMTARAAEHEAWHHRYQQLLDELDPTDVGAAARKRMLRLGIAYEAGRAAAWRGLAE